MAVVNGVPQVKYRRIEAQLSPIRSVAKADRQHRWWRDDNQPQTDWHLPTLGLVARRLFSVCLWSVAAITSNHSILYCLYFTVGLCCNRTDTAQNTLNTASFITTSKGGTNEHLWAAGAGFAPLHSMALRWLGHRYTAFCRNFAP